jgi:hypothetical protein
MTSISQHSSARILPIGARRPAASGLAAKAVWGGGPLPVRSEGTPAALIAFPSRERAPELSPDIEWGPSAA